MAMSEQVKRKVHYARRLEDHAYRNHHGVSSEYLGKLLSTAPENDDTPKLRSNSSSWWNHVVEASEAIASEWERMYNLDFAFDAIVVSGTSGLLVGPAIADQLGLPLVVVRKPDDGSHSGSLVEGAVGFDKPNPKYIVVDDFVSSGDTVARIMETMRWYRPTWSFVGAFQATRKEWWCPEVNAEGKVWWQWQLQADVSLPAEPTQDEFTDDYGVLDSDAYWNAKYDWEQGARGAFDHALVTSYGTTADSTLWVEGVRNWAMNNHAPKVQEARQMAEAIMGDPEDYEDWDDDIDE
jgi:hypoxanthine phosphoribosyltransferase